METVQLESSANCDAKREEHVNNTSHIVGEESPDKSWIHKKTLHGGSKDKYRPVINALMLSIKCMADAVKSNRDQDCTDRLFSEVMKTEGLSHPVLARAFITLRPHLHKEFCIKLASKLLVNGSTRMFGTSDIRQGAFGGQCMGSRLAAFTPTTEFDDSSSLPFVDNIFQSISALPVYFCKKHEDLRWGDYRIEKIFGTTGIGQATFGGQHMGSRLLGLYPTPENQF